MKKKSRRDHQSLEPVFAEIRGILTDFPNLRLGQILETAMNNLSEAETPLFYLENDELAKVLSNLRGWLQNQKRGKQ